MWSSMVDNLYKSFTSFSLLHWRFWLLLYIVRISEKTEKKGGKKQREQNPKIKKMQKLSKATSLDSKRWTSRTEEQKQNQGAATSPNRPKDELTNNRRGDTEFSNFNWCKMCRKCLNVKKINKNFKTTFWSLLGMYCHIGKDNSNTYLIKKPQIQFLFHGDFKCPKVGES